MTHATMPQPYPSNEELWKLYETQAETVEQAHQDFLRCRDEAEQAVARRQKAWDEWTEACRVHGELFDNAFEATYGQKVEA